MEPRQLRGAEIAESGGLQTKGRHLWLVPSQSHTGKWLVDYSSGDPTCTCPDYEANSAFCKHIFAIEIQEGRLSISEPTPKKKTYTQDWPAYNAAQTNERPHFVRLLRDLCDGIVMPVQKGRGRPKIPLSDVVFACTMKVYEGTSGRRASSEIQRCLEEGFLTKAPSYNTISDYLLRPDLTPLLRTLVQESASPLAGIEGKFATDSTGFGTTTYDRWFDQKWGRFRNRAVFVKSHICCGTLTHIVTDMIVSPRGDAVEFTPLLDATSQRFSIESVSADKAYSSKANLAAVDALGAVAYIPFKDGTKGGKQDLWSRMYHYYRYKRDDFNAHYHDRSNVETVFSMVKAKFDQKVRSKSPEAQTNEVYCKFLCHNIVVLVLSIYELGLVPEFWRPGAPAGLPLPAVKGA